ncbi:unnamed protein product [Calypogeia fissa]
MEWNGVSRFRMQRTKRPDRNSEVSPEGPLQMNGGKQGGKDGQKRGKAGSPTSGGDDRAEVRPRAERGVSAFVSESSRAYYFLLLLPVPPPYACRREYGNRVAGTGTGEGISRAPGSRQPVAPYSPDGMRAAIRRAAVCMGSDWMGIGQLGRAAEM